MGIYLGSNNIAINLNEKLSELDSIYIKSEPFSNETNIALDIASNKSIYYLNLADWGITDGFLPSRNYTFDANNLPIPKYTNEEWKIAYDNKYGIINALNYAKTNNYGTVVFPKCNIFICYEEPKSTVNVYYAYGRYPITIPSGMTVDLNNSVIKVIYDSHVANPYDKSVHDSSNPVYRLPGCIFSFSKSYHSCIKNGTLIGDIYERAFDDGLSGFDAEKGCEFTTGIEINKGSSFCAINNMIIRGFMGDAIASMTDHDPDMGTGVYNPQFKTQTIIGTDGVEKAEAGSYTTDYCDITSWKCREGIMRTNIGYTRVPNFKNPNFRISYYDINKVYLGNQTERYLQNFLIPVRTKYIKISIMNEAADLTLPFTKDFQVTPKAGEYCIISECEITENHRGGISNMVNHSIIEKTKIYNNGNGWMENFPTFPDSTRYAINCEDCLPLNIIIRDCYIYNHFNGILLAGNAVTVDNNIFKNMSSCLVLYNCESANFINNKIYNSGTAISNTSSSIYNRYITVANNKLFDSGLIGGTTSSTPIRYFVENNSMRGRINFASTENMFCDKMFIDYQKVNNDYITANVSLKNSSNIKIFMQDTFISTAKFNYYSDKYCKNIKIECDTSLTVLPPFLCSEINNTEMYDINIDTSLTTKLISNDNCILTINNSTIKNCAISSGNYINSNDQFLEAYYNSCTINIDSTSKSTSNMFITAWYYNNAYSKTYNYVFKNCYITIDANKCATFLNIPSAICFGNITFENCIITNTYQGKTLELVKCALSTGSNLNLTLKGCILSGQIVKSNSASLKITEQ